MGGERAIFAVEQHDNRPVPACFVRLEFGVGRDDHLIALLHEAGSGAIGTTRRGIGPRPYAFIDIIDP